MNSSQIVNITDNKSSKNLEFRFYFYLFLIVIAALTLYPLLFVGITTHDDAEISVNFGWGTSLLESAALKAELQGRIAFFWSYPLLRLPYAFESRIFYLTIKYGSLFILLAAFHYMIIKLIRSEWIAMLSLLLFFGFIQNGWDHNALTSYPFAINFIATLFLISICLFSEAIDKKRIDLSILAGLLYFLTLANESFVLFFPFFMVILARGCHPGESRIKIAITRWIYISPIIFGLLLYIFIYTYWRISHPSIYDGNNLNALNFIGASKVIGAYSLSALPFVSLNFIVSSAHQALYMSSIGLSELLTSLSSWHYIKPIIFSVLFYRLMSMNKIDIDKRIIYMLILLTLTGVFLPNILLGFVQKHQIWVSSGSYSYLYTFYSFLSLIILIALTLALIKIKSRQWQRQTRAICYSLLALLSAVLCFSVDVRNHFIANDQKLSNRKWILMDAITSSQMFADVPDGSVIVAPTLTSNQRGIAAAPASFWSKYVQKKTGKRIQFLDDGCKNSISCYSLVFRQDTHNDNQFLLFGKSAAGDYRLSSNFIFISQFSQRANFIIGTYQHELEVSSPSLTIDNTYIGNMGSGSFAAQLRSSAASDKIQIAQITGNVNVLLDGITVSTFEVAPQFQPLSVELGSGFYGWERNSTEPPWSWGKQISELFIFNNSNNIVTGNINFEVTSLENLTLHLAGAHKKSFSVVHGKYTPVSVTMKLAPGKNKLQFISDRPAIKPSSDDQRELSFSVRNFSIRPQ